MPRTFPALACLVLMAGVPPAPVGADADPDFACATEVALEAPTTPGSAPDTSPTLADSLADDDVPDSTAARAPAPAPATNRDDPLALRGHGRPHLVEAGLQAAHHYAVDVIYIYTAPIRMSGPNLFAFGAVTAVGGGLYAADGDIDRAVGRWHDDPLYQATIDAGEFFEPLGLISDTHIPYEVAAITGWVLDVPLLRTIPGEFLESHSIAGSFRQFAERTVHRRRPREGEGPRSFSGGSSFPSGHASVVCEVASIVSYHYKHPLVRATIWTIAGTVCAQRLDDRGHWASDVWMGAAYGAWAGHTIAKRNDERRHGVDQGRWYDILHRPPKTTWAAMPVVRPGYAGMQLVAGF